MNAKRGHRHRCVVADQVTIVDTRTPAEYATWHIPAAILIQYTELWQRLDEVPRDKPVCT